MQLEGKTTVITGAGRGIGRATALLFAQQGVKCVLASRTESELKAVASEIEKSGGKALTVVTDLSKDADIDRLFEAATNAFGHIDILVNNAGGGAKNEVVDARISDWDRILDLNLRGAMVTTKKCLPLMLKRKQGTIIQIVSMAGIHGYAGSSAYCASKFGLRGFSEALFQEVRESGIKVSMVSPGYVDTPLIPQTRKINREKMIRAEDIAKACLFVATSSVESCPTELVIQPQRNPLT